MEVNVRKKNTQKADEGLTLLFPGGKTSKISHDWPSYKSNFSNKKIQYWKQTVI